MMKSFADFQQMGIVCTGELAEVVFDHYQGKPVRLIGFTASASLTPFEILEQAFDYYCRLCDATKQGEARP